MIMKSVKTKLYNWIFEYQFASSFKYILVSAFITGLSLMLSKYLPIMLVKEHKYSEATADSIGGLIGGGAVVGIFALAWLSNLWGPKPLILAGLGGSGVATVLIVYAQYTWQYQVLALIVGMGNGVVVTAVRVYIKSTISDPDARTPLRKKAFQLYYWGFNSGITLQVLPIILIEWLAGTAASLILLMVVLISFA